MSPQPLPTVLCVAGLDPTGGAGLQADIETVASIGGHALPVLTASTVQNSHDLVSVTPVTAADLLAQGRAVITDIPPRAVKVGLLGNAEVANAVASLLDACPDVPVVLDPICASSAGPPLADEELLDAIVSLLIPRATLVTPNSREARLLAPEADSPAARAQQLLSGGCGAVLLTGTQEAGKSVEYRLYAGMRLQETWTYTQPAGDFRGSSCTLSAALATLLAHGVDSLAACGQALDFTYACLRASLELGDGSRLPNRLHWSSHRR